MNNKGFTLIEILITLIIISALILSVNKVIYTVKKANIIAENNFQASVYAQNILEYLKSKNAKLSEGEFAAEELLEENIRNFLKKDTKINKFDNSLIKIKNIYDNNELSIKIFEVEFLVVWKGVSDEQNYKISTYVYQK